MLCRVLGRARRSWIGRQFSDLAGCMLQQCHGMKAAPLYHGSMLDELAWLHELAESAPLSQAQGKKVGKAYCTIHVRKCGGRQKTTGMGYF